MTGKPLVFAYNAALIFTTSLIAYLFQKRILLACADCDFLAVAGNYQQCDPCQQSVTPFTGPDLRL